MRSITTLVALMAVWAQVHAQQPQACTVGTQVGNLRSFLAGQTVCAQRNGDRWQEFHQGYGQNDGSGALIDYKLGPGHKVDPSKVVGTWSATQGSNATVTYTYPRAGSYTFIVCQVNGTYNFEPVGGVTGQAVQGATLRTGQVSCD